MRYSIYQYTCLKNSKNEINIVTEHDLPDTEFTFVRIRNKKLEMVSREGDTYFFEGFPVKKTQSILITHMDDDQIVSIYELKNVV